MPKLFKKFLSLFLVFCMLTGLTMFMPLNAEAADWSSSAGIVSVSSGNLNVRSSASLSSPVLTKIPKDSYVTLISKTGNWWKIEYAAGKYGYCSASYIKQKTDSKPVYVNTAGGNLNVRSGPSSAYSVKDKLQNSKCVIKLYDNGNFSYVLYNGTSVGYVSTSYLKSQSNSSVKLNVPNYKQTDSRWSQVTLGSSGKTIGAIGCTTTALSMTESYRTGSVIHPDAMSKKLKYSSSGSLYWPSNYTFVTDSNSFLYTIRDLLRQGKPVILGCKKSSGSQHWVVVTGYNGGTVTASNFTINDPGSKTRTNLSDFLSVYPNFYKIAYYI